MWSLTRYQLNLISVASLICWGEMSTLLRMGVLRHKDISPIGSACCLLLFSPQFCLLVCVCAHVCVCVWFVLTPYFVCVPIVFVSPTKCNKLSYLFLSCSLSFSFALPQYIDLYYNWFLRVYSWHGIPHSRVQSIPWNFWINKPLYSSHKRSINSLSTKLFHTCSFILCLNT